MKYEMSKEERLFALKEINKLFKGEKKVDLTGTTISPNNLSEALVELGYVDSSYDVNLDDYWITFTHTNLSKLIMYYNAESFELTLEVADDD